MQATLRHARHLGWTALGAALLCLSLIGASAFSSASSGAEGTVARASTPHHITIPSSGHVRLLKTGTVDFSKLPRISSTGAANQSGRAGRNPLAQPLSLQERAYLQAVAHHKVALPRVVGQRLPTGTPSAAPSPNFDVCGYSDVPCQPYGYLGLNSNQSSPNGAEPDAVVASNPSYVLEVVNNALVVYNFSGGVVSGPVAATTFFSSVMVSGSTLVEPQVFWDASRGRWIIVMVNIYPDAQLMTGSNYIIAVSKTQNVALNPATQYNLYYFGTGPTVPQDLGLTYCVQPTLGSDYWGIYLGCTVLDALSSQFVANAIYAFSKNDLYSNAFNVNTAQWTDIPTDISCGGECVNPAVGVSPALEDGTPDAEFVLATDSGYGGPYANLTTCAITNTHALATKGTPTFTCVLNSLPSTYADAVAAHQPGGITVGVGNLMNQAFYKGGNLYFALTTAVSVANSAEDGVYWAETQPQLTALDPANPQNQAVSGTIMRQAGIWAYNGADSYNAGFVGSSEDDGVLVLDYSSASIAPSVAYTGRRATDAPGVMGVNGVSVAAISGVNASGSGWESYAGCSLDTNLTSRGLIWCAEQYGGPTTTPSGFGWDTYIFGLRAE